MTSTAPAGASPVLGRPHVRWVLAALCALGFAAVLLPVHQQVGFWPPDGRGALLRRAVLGIAFTGALTALVAFALKWADRVLQGDRRYKTWLAITGLYLMVTLPLWLLTWPGEWVNDEFWIVHLAKSWQADGWQGYLTIVLYTFAMMLYPSAVSVVLVQLVFAAVVVGRFATVVHEITGRRRAVLVVLVPLLSPAALVNVLYPMRLIPWAFLLLLVLAELLALRFRLPRTVGPVAGFIGLGIAVDVLVTWRSEGVVLLVLLPALLVGLGLHRRLRRDPASRTALLVVVGVLGLLVGVNSAVSSPAYGVVATVNPVTAIVNGPLHGERAAKDLRAIDSVIPVAAMRSYPSYTDVDAYWHAGLRRGYQSHLPEYYRAVADLVLQRPGTFLQNRWQVLLASNGLDREVPVVHPEHLADVDYGASDFGALAADDPDAGRIDAGGRLRMLQALFLVGPDGSPSLATRVVFNALPALLALIVFAAVAMIRRRWFWASIGTVLVVQGVVVVLTAPGALFMYFLPTYVVGTAVLSSALAVRLSRLADERAALDRLPGVGRLFAGASLRVPSSARARLRETRS